MFAGIITKAAFIWFLVRVGLLVNLEITERCSTILTLIAMVWGFFCMHSVMSLQVSRTCTNKVTQGT